MKPLTIAVTGLILGGILGTAWSFVEFSGSDPDMDDLEARLASTTETAVSMAGNPQLVVEDGPEFDFGMMDLSESKSHTFVLINEGDSPLTLDLLGTTCKCAIGTLPDGSIPPGGSGEVTMEWTAKGEAPEYRQSATIETNDPNKRVLRLSVFGKVVQILRAVPRTVTLTDVPSSAARTAVFELVNFKEDQFEMERFRWTNVDLEDYLEVEARPLTAEELEDAYGALSGYHCEVTVRPGLPMGSFKSELGVQLNGDRAVNVAVRGNVVTDIRVVGGGYRDRLNRLDLGMVPAEGTKRKLMILAKGIHSEGLQFRVDDIVPPVLSATVGEGQSLNDGAVWNYPLEIEVLPSDVPINHLISSAQAPVTLKLLTNHPTVPEIVIDVSFAIGNE